MQRFNGKSMQKKSNKLRDPKQDSYLNTGDAQDFKGDSEGFSERSGVNFERKANLFIPSKGRKGSLIFKKLNGDPLSQLECLTNTFSYNKDL